MSVLWRFSTTRPLAPECSLIWSFSELCRNNVLFLKRRKREGGRQRTGVLGGNIVGLGTGDVLEPSGTAGVVGLAFLLTQMPIFLAPLCAIQTSSAKLDGLHAKDLSVTQPWPNG